MVLERTDFEQFLCWGCGGLEPTDFHSFNIRRVWSLERTVDFEQLNTLGGCGGLERTHFNSFFGRVYTS